MKNDFVLFEDADGGGPDPSLDPDVALIAAYLAGELTVVQMAAIEERLSTDQAFRDKTQPILDAWLLPMSFAQSDAPATPSDAALTREEVDAGWQRALTRPPARWERQLGH
jgi:anti-sigma-K factor RskA